MRRRESEWQRRSPVEFTYSVVSIVATLAGVVAWATQRGHPGAVWWLVGALVVFALWAGIEALRFRQLIERHFSSVRHHLEFHRVIIQDRATPPGLRVGVIFLNKAPAPIRIKIVGSCGMNVGSFVEMTREFSL
jgi:hypothetical protein